MWSVPNWLPNFGPFQRPPLGLFPHAIANREGGQWGNAHEGFCGPPPAIRRATWRKEIGRLIGGCGRVWRPRTSPRQLPRQVTLTGLLHRVFFKVTETSGGRRVLAVVPGAGRTPLPRQAAVDELRRRPPGSAIFFAHVRGPSTFTSHSPHANVLFGSHHFLDLRTGLWSA